jgi:four helix bundle protein
MTPMELRERLADFAAAVARYAKPLFRRAETSNTASQLTRAASSAMANHRSAGRARSHSEFTSKLNVAVEEIDECQGWLKFMEQSGDVEASASDEHARLYAESTELTAILTASLNTARKKEEAVRTRLRRPVRR